MITVEQKTKIIEALETYMELHSMSQNDIATKADVNASYLIEMRKFKWTIKIGVKTLEFKDMYFTRIANLIGFELNDKPIETKATAQLSFIVSKLKDAMDHAETVVLIGQTGAGKTFSLDVFKRKFPAEVFSIKVGSSDNLNDILDKIAEELRLKDFKGTKSSKINKICRHLKDISEKGLNPMLVLDESEYMKQVALCAIKEIYDALLGTCPLVMLGTPELIQNLNRMILRKKTGISQLFRRLKFKIQYIPTIDTKFDLFLGGIESNLKAWLQENCANYGELTDILNPCLREAKRLGQPLTLPLVQMVLSI